MAVENVYEALSLERKDLQQRGECPEWFTTAGYQLFKEKYLYKAKTPKEQYRRIAKTAAKHIKVLPDNFEYSSWEEAFFELLWKGWLSPSTPILANMGTSRGLPVSCSGQYVGDSIEEIYSARRETAILTKHGFGTAGYLGDIRPRGAKISGGSKSVGVVPVINSFVNDMNYVAQGSCYHPNVEVMTESGFMPFYKAKELNLKLLQVATNGLSEFVHPDEFIEEDFTGDLVHLKDSKNIDIMVTGSHRMFVKPRKRITNKRNKDGKFMSHKKVVSDISSVVLAKDLKLHRDTVFDNSVKIRSVDGLNTNLTPLERYLIAFQADGHIMYGTTGNLCAGRFHLKKQRKVDRLMEILSDCGFEYTHSYYEKTKSHSFYVKYPTELKTFEWVDLTKLTLESAKEFLLEVSNWDGGGRVFDSKGRYSFSYSSTIKENIDVVQAIASLSGYKSKVTVRVAEGNKKSLYRVGLSEGSEFGGERITKNLVPYTGKVYCATVPFGGLLVRSSGHTLVCGNSRRGAFASYLPITHSDFDEVCSLLENEPDGVNIGWNYTDKDIASLNSGDKEAVRRFQKALRIKMITGRGYYSFVDKMNRHRPDTYVKHGLKINSPQLCAEICLHNSSDLTYTCVLSSMNLANWDDWKNTQAVFIATVFLDCVAEEFIQKGKKIAGLEKAISFTEKGRALGLGACGLHTLFQMKMLPFEGFEAHSLNNIVFKHLQDGSCKASTWLGGILGEPEWCQGFGYRNTHTMAIAPTKSTALIMGGVSEGINPDPAMTYTQLTAAGEVNRVNHVLLDLMKQRGIYDKEHIQELVDSQGSVQLVSWLSDHEKLVFKTAFEINQEAVIRLASARQRFVDQGQSINLFFSADEKEEQIAKVHKMAFEDENILSLYYCYSKRGVIASSGECIACQ